MDKSHFKTLVIAGTTVLAPFFSALGKDAFAYGDEVFGPRGPSETFSAPLDLDLPACGICEYSNTLNLQGSVLDASCNQQERYRHEFYDCQRWICSGPSGLKYKYVKLHVSWGDCQQFDEGAGCPNSTCE